ncbi:MAG TPA: ATP-binding protein [Chitinophagaceae bacterium]
MRRKVIYIILSAFTVGTFVLVYIQYNSSKSIDSLVHGDNRLLEEFAIRKNLNLIENNVISLQRNVRTMYVDKTDAPEAQMKSEINEILAAEKTLQKIDDDENTARYVDSLENAVTRKIMLCRKVVDTYLKNGSASANAVIDSNFRIWVSNDIEMAVQKIDSSRNAYITSITQAVDKSGKRAQKLNYLLTIVVLLSSVFLFWYIISIIQKLTQSEKKIKEASRIKESFMANMSHEIRTPINAILGFTALLERRNLDDQSQEYIKTIQKSGESLLTIINDILDLSKLEAGMMRIESAPFSVRALVHSIEVMFGAKVVEKSLNLQSSIDESMPDILEGDAIRLTQIFVNLIGNALKFTKEGTINIKVTGEERDGRKIKVMIVVSDTGIGIEKDKQQDIFSRFQQADDTITRHFGGTGLGLSIVSELVSLQKGTIRVESEPGSGTTFILMIPYFVADNQNENNTTLSDNLEYRGNTDFNSIRLLVAEDNEINQSLIRHLFREWKIEYDLAQNGKEAVAMVQQHKYDLVLMDIQMPEMDGYTATLEIRNILKLDIPIVAMTAHALAGEKEKCLSYGMSDYISKPMREAQLYKLITKFAEIPIKHLSKGSAQQLQGEYKCINLSYMREISGGNKDYEKIVTEQFIEVVPESLAAIETTWKNNDLVQMRQEAHNMKTTVSVMGLTEQLKPCLEELEYSDLTAESFSTQFGLLHEACIKALDEAKQFYHTFSEDEK